MRGAIRLALACAVLAGAAPPRAARGPGAHEGALGEFPERATGRRWRPGEHALRLERGRDGLVYVPRARGGGDALPLVVLLHGAGGDARGAIRLLRGLAERERFALLVPESRGATWDAVTGNFGADVDFLGRALARTLEKVEVDRSRLALAGFSDGASYALSLGLANGAVFTHVVAFSPGFARVPRPRGRPRVFVSHGVHDGVLPIATSSREIVPTLQAGGYAVRYREFDGGHAVPEEIAREAAAWFLGAPE